MSNLPPLPEGWVQQLDQRTQHPFWVDTRAQPPRSSWIHPYEDEQFLREHPDIRERIAAARSNRPPSDLPPPYSPRRNSFSGASGNLDVPVDRRNALSQPGTPGNASGNQHRGFLAKLKDKASQAGRNNQPSGNDRSLFGNHQPQRPYGYGPSGYGQQQYSQPMYGVPQGDPYAVSGGRYGGGLGGLTSGLGGRRHGGGMAMPLLGGMAGGLILGDLLDNRGGFGGGYGPGFGGGFGGGPFDNGFGGPFDNGFGGGQFDNGMGGGWDGGGFDGGMGGGW